MPRIRVVLCETCARRRRCTVDRRNDWYYWRCSQGHAWTEEAGTLDKMTEIMKQELLPYLREMFTASPFLAYLKR